MSGGGGGDGRQGDESHGDDPYQHESRAGDREGGSGAAGAPRSSNAPGGHGEWGDEVNALVDAIRGLAREDASEIARFSQDPVHFLPAATRARITDEILKAQRQTHASGTHAWAAPEDLDGAGAAAAPTHAAPTHASVPGRGLAPRGRRPAGWFGPRASLFLAAAVAAAALVALWMRPAARVGDAPLPGYAVAASGGVAELRGARAEGTKDGTKAGADDGADEAADRATTARSARLRPESELRVTLRPQRAVAGPVAVRAFFLQGGDVEELRPAIEVAPSGAAELRLRGADLVGRHRGAGILRVVVGRVAAVGALGATAAVGAGSDGSSLRWLTVPVALESP
jgi:hypothetical protein